jgi:DNA-binding MarR family transcriptional regulator
MSESFVHPPASTGNPLWQHHHLGHVLWLSQQRFEQRVLALLMADVEAPLALSNLAARAHISAAHVHITRHLPLEGARLTDLAERAGMTKQAMAHLVEQCEAWGLVERQADARDRRARQVTFTALGKDWLASFGRAVTQAQREFQAQVGTEVATVVQLGLEAYVQGS